MSSPAEGDRSGLHELSERVTPATAGPPACPWCLLAASGFGADLGLAGAVALALDDDHVGVVNDAIDERSGARGVREDAGPIAEGEIGGEDETLLFVSPADDLKQEVGVAIVEGEESDLVEHEESNASVVLEATLESAG